MHQYDAIFYDYINAGAVRSADVIIGMLKTVLQPKSVVDFGSGEGAWLHAWRKHGVSDVFGIDGAYVSKDRLLIPAEHFKAVDLGTPISLGRKFDFVESLEVAEHLPPDRAETFVDSLVRHGSCVLFSAAPPGQGGENHVNEKPWEYWRDLFARRGYAAFDWLRPRLRGRMDVELWYRYNPILFVHESIVPSLHASIKEAAIPPGAKIADVSPLKYRALKFVVRRLPVGASTALAVMKKRYFVWRRRRVAA
jgi:SAM-dependent methyltransferase